MTFVLGLTGSIGMGKSTTAKLFAQAGCDVWDADAAVHRLYSRGGAAVAPVRAIFPDAIEAQAVSRKVLKQLIQDEPARLRKIEKVVHPLVAADRAAFLKQVKSDIAVLDIPLLYETGGADKMDAVVVVSAPAVVQRARVLDRGTMTETQFEQILAKQVPDAEKRARADYVITTESVESANAQVQNVIADIRG
ncbi:MAG: dephospho-CoA kinase, partial [Paracoccaceae bacterium]